MRFHRENPCETFISVHGCLISSEIWLLRFWQLNTWGDAGGRYWGRNWNSWDTIASSLSSRPHPPPQPHRDRACTQARGGYSGFKWRGWSKDFWGFEIFDSGILLGRKISQVSLFFVWIFLGVFKTIWRFVVVPAYPGPANKVQPNPGWSCLELSFIILLLKQAFLGVSSVVRTTTRWWKDKFRWYDNKQAQTFNF